MDTDYACFKTTLKREKCRKEKFDHCSISEDHNYCGVSAREIEWERRLSIQEFSEFQRMVVVPQGFASRACHQLQTCMAWRPDPHREEELTMILVTPN